MLLNIVKPRSVSNPSVNYDKNLWREIIDHNDKSL